jgi:hypothetical protein
MKILTFAAAVALSTISQSALAKDVDQVGAADCVFAYTASATGSQSVIIGSAIEGGFSSQIAVAVGTVHSASGGGGR